MRKPDLNHAPQTPIRFYALKRIIIALTSLVICCVIPRALELTTAQTVSPTAKSIPEKSFGVTSINPVTFEAISPDGDPKSVADMNTPEMIEARRAADFDIMHPGPSAFETATTTEDKKALEAILHPVSPAAMLQSKSAEEQAEIQRALESMNLPPLTP